ncbi:MAG TPA: archaemetzincin [Thermoguttaceae bacterium]|nr:archaemetzincin [Thermoguttaceae bacterium]
MARYFLPLFTVCILSTVNAGCSGAEQPDDKLMLPLKFRKLLPLHTKMAEPQPGDWLDQHHEPGQTFRQYVYSRPIKPDEQRRIIYIQPLGDFSRTQRKIVDLTAEFMGLYFDLPVKIREDLSLAEIPAKARRKHPSWGMDQILSTYVLHDVLRPRLPKDAAVFLAFTPSDLWPGEGWNFVFGQASLTERVGVWSIYRNGDPEESDAAFRLCLLRTLKTATHETGHMFSMMHCTLFECNMCGSNHRAESDRRPIALCPHCLAKLCHATGADPQQRFEKLIAFCEANGLEPERAFYEKSLQTLRGS